jgi:hypothetical protein
MDWTTIWKDLSTGATWLDERVLEPLSKVLERGVDLMAHHPNVVAAAIYLVVVLAGAWGLIWLLRESHINRVMYRNWDKRAGKRVLSFMLVFALANGFMHAVHQLTPPFAPDVTKPVEAFMGVPFVQTLSLYSLVLISLNLALLIFLCAFFLVDAVRNDTFYLPGATARRAASYYFGHVLTVFVGEEVITAIWEHYEAKSVVGELVKLLHSWGGKNVVIAIFVVILTRWFIRRCRRWLSEVTPRPKTT